MKQKDLWHHEGPEKEVGEDLGKRTRSMDEFGFIPEGAPDAPGCAS